MRFSKAPLPCFTLRMFCPCAQKHRCDFIPVTVCWKVGGVGCLGGQWKVGRSDWYDRKHSNKWNLKWGCCPRVISKHAEQQVFIASCLNRWSTITEPTSQNDPKRRHLKSASSSALALGTTEHLWAGKEQSRQQIPKRFTGAFLWCAAFLLRLQAFLDILNITENSTFSS